MKIISAKTVDRNTAESDMCEYVRHEVTYWTEEWGRSKKIIMARDPVDAINKVRRLHE